MVIIRFPIKSFKSINPIDLHSFIYPIPAYHNTYTPKSSTTPRPNKLVFSVLSCEQFAEAPFHLTSYTQHTSILRLVSTSTTSPERPRIVPTFQLRNLNLVLDRKMTFGQCSSLTPLLPCARPLS